jgi:hypothetical protein
MDAALGGQLEFQFFHAWFNGLFIAAALTSMAVFWWHYQQGALGGAGEPLLPVVALTAGNGALPGVGGVGLGLGLGGLGSSGGLLAHKRGSSR